MPDILLEQRLWAEEGLFYQNAWSMPAWQAVRVEYGGYLNIVANASGVIARYAVPLRDAPLVTTGIGLAFQALPAVVMVTSRATWLRQPAAMMLAVIALAATPATEEVWLQTLHSQNHLALCAALILSFDDTPGPLVRWLRRGLLLLGPLSGMLAAVVLPLMLARAVLERRRERVIQCGLLAVGAVVQVGLFYSPAGGAALGRSNPAWSELMPLALLIRHVAAPLLGAPAAGAIGEAVASQAGRSALWPLAVLAGVFATAGLASLRRVGAPWLLAAGVGVAAASYAGAIGDAAMFLSPFAGERYSFVPAVLLTCSVIAIASGGPADGVSRLATVLATWLIGVGLVDYARPSPRFATGPAWRDEVARWEADPDYLIRLWPQGWSMQLGRDHGEVRERVRPPSPPSPLPQGEGFREGSAHLGGG